MSSAALLGPSATESSASRWIGRSLSVVGLFAVAVLVWRAGTEAVFHAMQRVGVGGVAIVLAPIIGMVLHCGGWMVLLPVARRPTPMVAVSVYVAAQAGDELGAGIAGEPLKCLVLHYKDRSRAVAAVTLDNATQLIAVGLFMLLAGSGVFALCGASYLANSVLWASVGMAAGLGVVLALTTSLIIYSARRHRQHRWARGIVRVSDLSFSALRAKPRRLLGSVCLHLLGKAWIVPEMALALALLKSTPTLALYFASVSVGASLLGAAIPGQVGAVECALVAAGAATGVDSTTVMALALLRRLRSAFWIGIGMLLVGKVIEYARHRADWRSRGCPRHAKRTIRQAAT